MWKQSINKEVSVIMGQKTFEYLEGSYKNLKTKGFMFAHLCMIFDVKQDGHCKARLVIGRHVLDLENIDAYSSVMKAIPAWLLMVIAKANNYTVWTGDIKSAYFYAECNIKVCTTVGPEFELAGYTLIKDGSMAQVVKALYGLPSSGRNWHINLAGTLRMLGFKPPRFDQDVFMRVNESCDGYNYI